MFNSIIQLEDGTDLKVSYKVEWGQPEKLIGHPDTWHEGIGDDIEIVKIYNIDESKFVPYSEEMQKLLYDNLTNFRQLIADAKKSMANWQVEKYL
jgi:hypothetical protein